MKKIVAAALLFISVFFSFAQTSLIRLGVLTGISCAPCAYLIENKKKLAVQNMDFEVFDSARSELPKLLRGELDVGFLAPADAAKVFTAGNGVIVALGVVQNGNAVLLTNDEKYQSLEDLRGSSILCAENDIASTALFKHLLTKKEIALGAESNSVRLDFSVPAANIASKLISGEEKYALLSEPFASIAAFHSSKITRAENLQKRYSEAEAGSAFPAMLLVARADFANENRDLLCRFIEVYKNALSWTNKNPAKAALLSEKQKRGLSEGVVRSSIPNANLVWRDAKSAQSDLEKVFALLECEPPSAEFYF